MIYDKKLYVPSSENHFSKLSLLFSIFIKTDEKHRKGGKIFRTATIFDKLYFFYDPLFGHVKKVFTTLPIRVFYTIIM